MSEKVRVPQASVASDADLGRSHVVFVAVGLAIVLGGLWLLYQAEGPYHPDDSVTRSQVQLLEDG